MENETEKNTYNQIATGLCRGLIDIDCWRSRGTCHLQLIVVPIIQMSLYSENLCPKSSTLTVLGDF